MGYFCHALLNTGRRYDSRVDDMYTYNNSQSQNNNCAAFLSPEPAGETNMGQVMSLNTVGHFE